MPSLGVRSPWSDLSYISTDLKSKLKVAVFEENRTISQDFFNKFVSWANNSNIHQPSEFSRINRMESTKEVLDAWTQGFFYITLTQK